MRTRTDFYRIKMRDWDDEWILSVGTSENATYASFWTPEHEWLACPVPSLHQDPETVAKQVWDYFADFPEELEDHPISVEFWKSE